MAPLQRAKGYIFQIATSGSLFLVGENEKESQKWCFLEGLRLL